MPQRPRRKVNEFFEGKRIFIYANGKDAKPGKPFTVTAKDYPTLSTLLDAIADRVRLGETANNLYTTEGRRVKYFGDIETGEGYVVAKDKFIPGNYGNEKESGFKQARKTNALTEQESSRHGKKIRRRHSYDDETSRGGGRIRTQVLENYEGKRIEIFKNGADAAPGKKVTVSNKMYSSNFEQMLDGLGELVGESKPQKLYSVSGKRVKRIEDIESGEGYVVVRDKFKRANYGDEKESGFRHARDKDPWEDKEKENYRDIKSAPYDWATRSSKGGAKNNKAERKKALRRTKSYDSSEHRRRRNERNSSPEGNDDYRDPWL